MSGINRPASSQSNFFKIGALLCVVVGFVIEMVAVALDHEALFKAGLFLFLMGIPCFLFGWFFGRRK